MLKGVNELHLNKATVQGVLGDWLKNSWPAEAGALAIQDISWDMTREMFVFKLGEPAPAPAPVAVPPADPVPTP